MRHQSQHELGYNAYPNGAGSPCSHSGQSRHLGGFPVKHVLSKKEVVHKQYPVWSESESGISIGSRPTSWRVGT